MIVTKGKREKLEKKEERKKRKDRRAKSQADMEERLRQRKEAGKVHLELANFAWRWVNKSVFTAQDTLYDDVCRLPDDGEVYPLPEISVDQHQPPMPFMSPRPLMMAHRCSMSPRHSLSSPLSETGCHGSLEALMPESPYCCCKGMDPGRACVCSPQPSLPDLTLSDLLGLQLSLPVAPQPQPKSVTSPPQQWEEDPVKRFCSCGSKFCRSCQEKERLEFVKSQRLSFRLHRLHKELARRQARKDNEATHSLRSAIDEAFENVSVKRTEAGRERLCSINHTHTCL